MENKVIEFHVAYRVPNKHSDARRIAEKLAALLFCFAGACGAYGHFGFAAGFFAGSFVATRVWQDKTGAI